MAERCVRNAEVRSSTLLISTIYFQKYTIYLLSAMRESVRILAEFPKVRTLHALFSFRVCNKRCFAIRREPKVAQRVLQISKFSGIIASKTVSERAFAAQKQYSKIMNRIIAVDFDGTVVTHEYPEVGQEVPHAVRVLKRLNESGVKIIVWTMRCGEYLEKDAADWFKKRDIEVWSYNTNPQQRHWTESPKCYAQLYIDDAALGCPLVYPEEGRPYVDWLEAEKFLIEKGYL